MTLSESVATLTTLVPKLKASDAKFASDLIASFKKYGGLTPKQEPWIERLIARASAPVAPVAAAVNVGGFAGVVALFTTAQAHLKFPKIRLVLNGTHLVLSLNGPKSKRPGHVSISGEGTYPNRAFYGSVSPTGEFTPFKGGLVGLTDLLSELASNPARVAKDHGKLTGNCCFCGKVLGLGEDKRSVVVGFGPVCADHYGLKAEWLSGAAKAEAKASVASDPTCQATYYTPTLAVPASSVAPLKLEGPWLGAANADSVVSYGTNPDEFQAELGPEYAAADQAKNDDDKAQDAANHEALQAELGPDYLKVCFFCEQPSTSTKTLHGTTVCATCISQLA